MNKFFTKFFVAALALCFTFGDLMAQIPNNSLLPVTCSTTDANGNYATYEYSSMADFGLVLTSTVTAPIEWARDDGMYDPDATGVFAPDSVNCSWGTTMDMTGKMALVRRGNCFFSQKIYNAQAAGAVGVIICNNNADDPDEVIGMAGSDSMDAVVIPAVFISLNSCQTIASKVDLGEEIMGSFEVVPFFQGVAGYSYATPLAHVLPMDSLAVSLLNVSETDPINNITATLTITQPDGADVVFTQTVDEILPVNAVQYNFDSYTPIETGTYTATYTNDATTDVITRNFEITENYWAMDNNNINDWIAASDDGFVEDNLRYDAGNFYYTGPEDGKVVTHVSFQLENPAALISDEPENDKFDIRLYNAAVGGVQPTGQETTYDGFQTVGFGTYLLDGSETSYGDIVVELEDPVPVLANGTYLAMVQYDGILSALGIAPRYAFGGTETHPRFESAVFTDQLYMGGWSGGYNMVVRLHDLSDVVIGVEDPLAKDQVKVYPNPTSDFVNLELDLANVADEVKVSISDAQGRVIKEQIINNVGKEIHSINVSSLTNGGYFMTIITPEGYRTKHFVVAK